MGDLPDIDALIEQCRTGDVRAQVQAVLALKKANARVAVDAILPLVESDSEWLRSVALEALVDLGADRPELIGPVVARRLADPDDSIRHRAAQALGWLRYAPAREALERILLDDPEFVPRASCAEALGEIGDPRSLPALIAALDDDYYPVAAFSALSIGLIGDRSALPALRARLDSNWDPYSRHELAIAAMRLGDDSAFDDLVALFEYEPEDEGETFATTFGNGLHDMLTRNTPPVVLARADELDCLLAEHEPELREFLAKLRGDA